jgi:hypothetical protein
VGTFEREKTGISKCAVDILQYAISAKLMTAILQSIGSVGLFAANTTHICIYHFFLGDSERLDEVHEVVESFLHVQCAAFQEESLAVDLEFDNCEGVVSFDFLQFLGIGLEELEGFGVKTNSIEEVIINSSPDLLLYLLNLITFH